MLNFSDADKQLFFEDSRKKDFIIHFPNGEYSDWGNDKFVSESMSYTESLCSQDELKFGLCESACIKFTTCDCPSILNLIIQPFICVTRDNGTTCKVPLGYFTVKEDEKQNNSVRRNVVAYDVLNARDLDKDVSEIINNDIDNYGYAVVPDVLRKIYPQKLLNIPKITDTASLTYPNLPTVEIWDHGFADISFDLLNYDACGEIREISIKKDILSIKLLYLTFNFEEKSNTQGVVMVMKKMQDYIKKFTEIADEHIETLISDFIETNKEWHGTFTEPFYATLFNSKATNQTEDFIPRKNINILNMYNPYTAELFKETSSYGFKATATYQSELIEGENIKINQLFGLYYYDSNSKKMVNWVNDGFFCLDNVSKFYMMIPYAIKRKFELKGGIYGYTAIDYSNETDWEYICNLERTASPYYWGDNLLYNKNIFNGMQFIEYTNETFKATKPIGKTLKESDWDNIMLQYSLFPYDKTNANTVNSALITEKVTNVTKRQLLKSYYELRGEFGRVNRSVGNIEGVQLGSYMGLFPKETLYPSESLYPKEAQGTLTSSLYISARFEDFETEKIGHVVIAYKDGTFCLDYKNGGNNYYNLTDNFILQKATLSKYLVAQLVATIFMPAIDNVSYNPCDITLKGHPCMEAGDTVSCYTILGDGIETIALEYTFSGIQALKSSIRANGVKITPPQSYSGNQVYISGSNLYEEAHTTYEEVYSVDDNYYIPT